MGSLATDHAETMDSINAMIVAHDDAIWIPSAREDM